MYLSQRERGKGESRNLAGGYAFQTDKWQSFDRFLILGTEGGTYYIGERELTKEQALNTAACIAEDGGRAVGRIVEISKSGRAAKNDPAIFALALAAAAANPETRHLALWHLHEVCRTGTHLFHFVEYVTKLRGWGRGLKRAVAEWYERKTPDQLAYQLVKYQQRDGWSHRDLLRLSHPKPDTEIHRDLYKWATGKYSEDMHLHSYIIGFEVAKSFAKEPHGAKEIHAVVNLIKDYNLTREMLPTAFLNYPEVWEALLVNMPYEAMTRNLATMTSVGLLTPFSAASKTIAERLGNQENILRSRLHPVKILSALNTYGQGKGFKSDKTWMPVQSIIDALDGAFYLAFGNVTPIGKGVVFGVDCSGSMDGSSDRATFPNVAGIPDMSPRMAAAAMCLVSARTEPMCEIIGFSTTPVTLTISPTSKLSDVIKAMKSVPAGGTDCAVPMTYALKRQYDNIGLFAVYTDNETWAGTLKPHDALKQYQDKYNPTAKSAVVAMVSTSTSIARGDSMMDFVGFDTNTPQAISEFARG